MGHIIGIDLGTTNSVVAIVEGAEAKVITNPAGARTTPSVVGFKKDPKGKDVERIVGQAAKNQALTNPENTIYSIKRFMGRRPGEVGSEKKLVPYKIVGKDDELVKVEVLGRCYDPPEVSAMVLAYMKKYAEDYLGEKVTDAVITVPAYFNDAQRTATKEAGEIAGLKVRRILNEPTAAALAYGLEKKKDEKILVYDLGGGTFDVSVLEVSASILEVRSTAGDTHLGGDDFDQAIMDFLVDRFKRDNGIDLRKDKQSIQRLREAAERCKVELSASLTSKVSLPFIAIHEGAPRHLDVDITRAQFEAMTKSLVDRTRKPVEQALKDAKLDAREIDEVVLVGGSTRIPAVQELVRQMFGKEPNRSVNPDEVVAIGAAIQGGVLSTTDEGGKSDLVLLDVTPLTLGVETAGGIMTPMIQRNTTIPTQKKEVFSTAEDDQPAVDVKVYQGERKMADKNRLLDKFRLSGIRRARRGVPQIEVTFDIDVNGILSVAAKDLDTGTEQRVVAQGSSGLSREDIERMKREAEESQEEDDRRAALAVARNKADQVLATADEAATRDPMGFVSDMRFLSSLSDLKTARAGSDAAKIEQAIAALEAVCKASIGEASRSAKSVGAVAAGELDPEGDDEDSDDEDSDDEDSDDEDSDDEDSDDEDEDSDDGAEAEGDDMLESAQK